MPGERERAVLLNLTNSLILNTKLLRQEETRGHCQSRLHVTTKYACRFLRLTRCCSRAVTPTPQVCSPGSWHVDDKPWTGFGEAAHDMEGKVVRERGELSSTQYAHPGSAKASLRSGVVGHNLMHTGKRGGSRPTGRLVTARIELPGFARAGRPPRPSIAPSRGPPIAIAANSTASYYPC